VHAKGTITIINPQNISSIFQMDGIRIKSILEVNKGATTR